MIEAILQSSCSTLQWHGDSHGNRIAELDYLILFAYSVFYLLAIGDNNMGYSLQCV